MYKKIYNNISLILNRKSNYTPYPFDNLIKSLGISKIKFLKTRYHWLMIEIINNSPNDSIKNDLLIFNKKYLLLDFNNWDELLEFYSTEII